MIENIWFCLVSLEVGVIFGFLCHFWADYNYTKDARTAKKATIEFYVLDINLSNFCQAEFVTPSDLEDKNNVIELSAYR